MVNVNGTAMVTLAQWFCEWCYCVVNLVNINGNVMPLMVFFVYVNGTSMVNMNGIPMVLLCGISNGKHEWYSNGITVWYFNGNSMVNMNGIPMVLLCAISMVNMNGIPMVLLCGISMVNMNGIPMVLLW